MIATLTIFVAIATTVQDRLEMPVKHVSAAYIAELMTPPSQPQQGAPTKGLTTGEGLLPIGVTLELTPGRNSITVSGPIAGLREIAMLIAQFDVAPRAVTLDIKASVPHLSRQISASTAIYNNSSWTYSETRSGTDIKITPRINNDDTITLAFRGGTLGTSAIGAVRINSGQVVYVWIHPDNVENTDTGNVENRLVFSYATLPIELKSFLTDPNPFEPSVDWTIRQFNADWNLGDQSPLNPPVEADLRIRIKASFPGETSSQ